MALTRDGKCGTSEGAAEPAGWRQAPPQCVLLPGSVSGSSPTPDRLACSLMSSGAGQDKPERRCLLQAEPLTCATRGRNQPHRHAAAVAGGLQEREAGCQ